MSADIPERFRVPSEPDYLIEARKLQLVFGEGDAMRSYMAGHFEQEMKKSVAMRTFVNFFEVVGKIIEPADSSTGLFIDKNTPVLKSVVQGAVAGRILAARVHRRNVGITASLDELRVKRPVSASPSEEKHHFANRFLEYGTRGLALLNGETRDIVDSWGDIFGPLTADKFSLALGMVAFSANAMHVKVVEAKQQAEVEELKAQLEAGSTIDWENELVKLMGGPEAGTSS